jgi:amidophosphoribosyltransferase
MIGIYDQNGLDVQDIVYFGLFALQHRGQESAGIAVANSEMLYHKGMGWVGDVFDEQTLNSLNLSDTYGLYGQKHGSAVQLSCCDSY